MIKMYEILQESVFEMLKTRPGDQYCQRLLTALPIGGAQSSLGRGANGIQENSFQQGLP